MTPPDTLAFHAAAPGGDRGRVLVLWRPDAEGNVACREWSSEAWLAPGHDRTLAARGVLGRVEQWVNEGWTLSEPIGRIRAWLGSRR